MKTKLLIVISVGCLIVLALWAFGALRQQRVVEAGLPMTSTVSPTAAAASQIEPVKSTGTAIKVERAAGKASPTLAAQMDTAPDLRAFAISARQHPAEGGLAYANAALAYCRQARFILKDHGIVNGQRMVGTEEDSQVYLKRLNAAGRLQSRCASFSDSELSREAQSSNEEMTRQRDRVHLATQSVLDARKAGSEAALADALRRAFELRDPLVLEEVFPGALTRRRGDGQGSEIFLDGKRYVAPESTLIIEAASLLPCHFGKACGPEDISVAVNCASVLPCFDNKADMLKSAAPGTDSDRARKIDEYLKRLIEIVESGNPARLAPPS